MSGLLPALGGGANGVVQLAAGGLTGVLAMGALIAGGVVPVSAPSSPAQGPLPVWGCFGTGSILAMVQPRDQMWITARSADGKWLQVFLPDPVSHYGWVDAASVELQADGSTLRVEGCGEVASATGTPGPTAVPATATPTAGPTATPTASPTAKPTATPTVRPTQAAPTAKPTAKPTPTPNLGPVFSLNPPEVGPARIGTNPLGTGNCGTSGVMAGLKTAATDPDGIAAIQLWIQKPGSSSFVLLSHGFSKDGTYWYAWIDTAKDKITVVGTLSYRAVAIDTKGVTTASNTGSLEIFRCDTEATISGGIDKAINGDGSYTFSSCSSFTIPWRYYLSDPDGLTGATITYAMAHVNKTTLRGSVKLTHLNRSLFWVASATIPSSYYGTNTLSWTITTTDKYATLTSRSAGRTSQSRNFTVNLDSCVE
jgi:hypothetical protein